MEVIFWAGFVSIDSFTTGLALLQFLHFLIQHYYKGLLTAK